MNIRKIDSHIDELFEEISDTMNGVNRLTEAQSARLNQAIAWFHALATVKLAIKDT